MWGRLIETPAGNVLDRIAEAARAKREAQVTADQVTAGRAAAEEVAAGQIQARRLEAQTAASDLVSASADTHTDAGSSRDALRTDPVPPEILAEAGLGGVASFIPVIGGFIGAGVGLMRGLWMQVCAFRVEQDPAWPGDLSAAGFEVGNGVTLPFAFIPITTDHVDQCISCFSAAALYGSGPAPYNSCAEGIIGGTGSAIGGGIPFPYPAWMFMADSLKDGVQSVAHPVYVPDCGQ